MSKLQRIVANYRAQLMRHEAQAAHALTTAYQHALSALQPRLDALYRAMADRRANGFAVPVSWLYAENRLNALKQSVYQQMHQFGHVTQQQVAQLQQIGVSLGTHSAQAQLQALVPSGGSYAFHLAPPDVIAHMIGATRKGSPLATLFAGFGEEAAQKTSNALVTGLVMGENPRAVASLVEDALDISRSRALTIARTEMLRAYRDSAIENYRANSAVCSQWRWTASLSSRTCVACLAMDGTLHSIDEDFGSHVNCRCAPVPVTKSWNEILEPLGYDASGIDEASLSEEDIPTGSDWLESQDAATQKQVLGNKYTGWSNGDFTLSEMVGHTDDPEWGHAIYEKSLAQLEED